MFLNAGFNKQEAREALQFEAFRRFGSQAKGITNIIYGEKSGFIPGSKRVSEVSGEVITWEGKTPPQKKVIEKEKETKPEPAKEPSPPAPNTKTEPKVSAPSLTPTLTQRHLLTILLLMLKQKQNRLLLILKQNQNHLLLPRLLLTSSH